jgi:hypothetical protein
MNATTLDTRPLAGLDEIDARRLIAHAVAELVDTWTHEDTSCAGGVEAAAGLVGDALDTLECVTDTLARLVRAAEWGPPVEVWRLNDDTRRHCDTLAATLRTLGADVDEGCGHTPTSTPAAVDVERFAVDLLDRLDAAGYILARIGGGW